MSRKFDRKQRVVSLASGIIQRELARPDYVARHLRPKPNYLPEFIWKKLITFVLNVEFKEDA